MAELLDICWTAGVSIALIKWIFAPGMTKYVTQRGALSHFQLIILKYFRINFEIFLNNYHRDNFYALDSLWYH